MFKNIDFR